MFIGPGIVLGLFAGSETIERICASERSRGEPGRVRWIFWVGLIGPNLDGDPEFPFPVDPNVVEGLSPNGSSAAFAAVDLYWIPLGAGAYVVRLSGKLFEAISAGVQRRRPCDLYHSALEVTVPEGRYVIEMTPIPDVHGERRGVVLEGAVGTGLVGRFRVFRYEIRRWRDGRIPDLAEAVTSPVRVTEDVARASQILDLVPSVPALVWGRDELRTRDMWNSNSVIAWLLARAGIDVDSIDPPTGGRAPGWRAGLAAARRFEGVPARSVGH